ncbi:nuclear transport factor 2 family protein [Dyadobacter sp. CY345]|uniref:nuclear transport factor 2 family protein n=1 Tax=Dyadobacter sp. CY345 TaxID=2909335 RepID=UPI001F487844|nr:nuclear transport factor 2 family protein [Dyadobacter sp. CY345]MCF2447616.1 nuclear transport factor 2 family protein [Dyadobacter sp. CY345]
MEVTQQEKQGILRAIDFYVEGGRKASGKITAEAFSPTATMSFTEDGKLKSVPIQALIDGFEKGEPMEASYELTTLDVAEDVAIVRIESQFGPGKYSDMFTLVKDGDQWKIVSKIFHTKK